MKFCLEAVWSTKNEDDLKHEAGLNNELYIDKTHMVPNIFRFAVFFNFDIYAALLNVFDLF